MAHPQHDHPPYLKYPTPCTPEASRSAGTTSSRAHLSDQATEDSRQLSSADPKVDAALAFTRAVLETRGGVSDADIERVRAAGYSDGEIAEIIAHVALSVLTN